MIGRTNACCGMDTSDATATASQILSGATAYVDDVKITGTMTNRGAVTQALNCGGSYTIPAGYHNGSGKVTANSLASQTDGTATAAQILTGQTAYVDGSKVTGTMANKGAVTGSITTSGGSYTIPAGYHNGSGKVTGPTLASLVGTNVTLASAANLLTGNTAYGKNGTKYTGSMASKAGSTVTATTMTNDGTKTYLTIPSAGYYSTSSKVAIANTNLCATSATLIADGNANTTSAPEKASSANSSYITYELTGKGVYVFICYPYTANGTLTKNFIINSSATKYTTELFYRKSTDLTMNMSIMCKTEDATETFTFSLSSNATSGTLYTGYKIYKIHI